MPNANNGDVLREMANFFMQGLRRVERFCEDAPEPDGKGGNYRAVELHGRYDLIEAMEGAHYVCALYYKEECKRLAAINGVLAKALEFYAKGLHTYRFEDYDGKTCEVAWDKGQAAQEAQQAALALEIRMKNRLTPEGFDYSLPHWLTEPPALDADMTGSTAQAERYICFILDGGKSVTSLPTADMRPIAASEDGTQVELTFDYIDEEDGEELAPPLTVRITGRNLGSVAAALRAGQCRCLTVAPPGTPASPQEAHIEAIDGL